MDGLTEALASEQRKSRELQWAFEREKCKRDKTEKQGQEELEVSRRIGEMDKQPGGGSKCRGRVG